MKGSYELGLGFVSSKTSRSETFGEQSTGAHPVGQSFAILGRL